MVLRICFLRQTNAQRNKHNCKQSFHCVPRKCANALAIFGHAAARPRSVMNSRRSNSDRKVWKQHLSGPNNYFDRGETGIKSAAAPHSRCHLRGQSRPSKSALAPPFVVCAPNNDHRRCNAASAVTCQSRPTPAPTFTTLMCRWRGRPQHEKRTFELQINRAAAVARRRLTPCHRYKCACLRQRFERPQLAQQIVRLRGG